ncbi:MAG: chromosomal replication initiator protein DnaA [bacterium]|nr:chromosomal replication initiator protein DnaA [bacterium]
MVNAQDAWEAAYRQLELQLDRATFDTWLRDAVFLRAESDMFTIGVRNSYARDMLQHRLYRGIRRALTDVWQRPVELQFEVYTPPRADGAPADDMPLFRLLAQQEPAPAPVPLHQQVARPQRPDLPESELNARYTFDRFVVGTENEMVFQAALAVSERPAIAYNPFFIYGDVGLGKTHLLQAVAHACIGRGLRTTYIPSEVFTNDLIDSIRQRSTAMFREKYRSTDVLLIDDVQFIAGKDSTQEEFFHTFNALYMNGKQIVIASDRPPRELETLEARLRSRFEGGLVMDVQPPTLETRIAILRSWARERGVTLEPRVYDLIAERTRMNVRELEGFFHQMVAAAQLSRAPLRVEAAQELLDTYRRPRQYVTLRRVVEVVAEHHRLTADDLVGPRRDGHINNARQIAMYLARELTGASLSQIGDAFGRKHTTVLHGCSRVADDLEYDLVTRAIVEEIRTRLQNGD